VEGLTRPGVVSETHHLADQDDMNAAGLFLVDLENLPD
jgi:hypothetical protein